MQCARKKAKGKVKTDEKRIIYYVLLVGLLGCGILIGGFLAFEGSCYSYFPIIGQGQADLLMRDNMVLHIMFSLCFGMLCWWGERKLLQKLSDEKREFVCRIVLAVSAVLLFTIGTILVHTSPYYPVGDQLNTTAGAYYCMQGNYAMLSPDGYIGIYPQQKGFMFLYEILFGIFGSFSYGAAQQFHVLFLVLTLLSGYGFLKNMSFAPILRIIYCILMLFCTPLLLFLPYIYGDVPSICFSMVLFWALSAYYKKLQKRYVCVAAVAAALSLMCRMNTLIVLIAVAIGIIMTAAQRWNYRPLVAGLCIILAAVGTIKAVDAMYEYRSGYTSDTGIPSILWIAMGLQETDGKAGVYNRYQQTVFEECGFDRERAASVGKEYIVQRLQEFQQNLPMARDFFLEKMRSQWMEPLFESLAATDTFEEGKPLAGWMHELYYGKLHDIVWKVANYYQSLVYIGVFLCLMGRTLLIKRRKENSVYWIPMIAIVGGFLFSLMWENQSRYCLPYYVFMLLYVPEGIMQIGNGMEQLFQKISRRGSCKREKEGSELRKAL